MIDFSNGSVSELGEIHSQDIAPAVLPIQGEQMVACTEAMHDLVVFTDEGVMASADRARSGWSSRAAPTCVP